MQQIINEIQNDIEAIRADLTLIEEVNFESRNNAIDFLDFHVLDRLEGLLQNKEFEPELNSLKADAIHLKYRLTEVDNKVFNLLRNELRKSDGLLLKTILKKYLGNDIFNPGNANKIGYDNADIFVQKLLTDKAFDADVPHPEPEMVYYQQTPARIILNLAVQANFKPDDVFFDLGSGLGIVVMLINLLTGIKTKGIEYESAYVDYANICASRLNRQAVEFINSDARLADYSTGTIFFLYTPFTGSILQDVLGMLKTEALTRPIKIFTYGPCSAIVARESWLHCANTDPFDIYQLYQFNNQAL